MNSETDSKHIPTFPIPLLPYSFQTLDLQTPQSVVKEVLLSDAVQQVGQLLFNRPEDSIDHATDTVYGG